MTPITNQEQEKARSDQAEMTEGELWSWVRSVMTQGIDIYTDYLTGKYGYEGHSARLDAAAAQRQKELTARLSKAAPAQQPDQQVYLSERGIPHHVDHEYPLQGRLVSGLHVENNGHDIREERNSFSIFVRALWLDH